MNIKYVVTSHTQEFGWESVLYYDSIECLPDSIGVNEFYETWLETKEGYKTINRTTELKEIIANETVPDVSAEESYCGN